MIARKRWGLVLSLILAVGMTARAADEKTVTNMATKLLEEISSDPESGIPPQFLREAKGILIWPRLVETELGVGRKKGQGVFLRRNANGEWGNPVPVEISAVSVGPQVGRDVREIVVIYRTEKAVDRVSNPSWSLGLGFKFSSSRGLPHKFHGPKPDDSKAEKDGLVYSRKSGFLAGVHLIGEHKTGTSRPTEESKAPADADRKEDDVKVTAKVSKGAAASEKTAGDSAEVARLKATLTAMTTVPKAQVTGPVANDPKVSQASAAEPIPEMVKPPR